MEESNPVKEYLFDYIRDSESKFRKLISQQKFSEVIQDVLENCHDKVVSMGDKDEAIGVLATALLHYLLTNALINSQRKVEKNGTEIDIIIPDMKTLEKDPKMALVVVIPKSSNKQVILEKISEIQEIQPERKNIWLILSQNIPINLKTFVISKYDSNFTNIIYEIAQFTNVNSQNKFKILRV